jgi:hypothetical protein
MACRGPGSGWGGRILSEIRAVAAREPPGAARRTWTGPRPCGRCGVPPVCLPRQFPVKVSSTMGGYGFQRSMRSRESVRRPRRRAHRSAIPPRRSAARCGWGGCPQATPSGDCGSHAHPSRMRDPRGSAGDSARARRRASSRRRRPVAGRSGGDSQDRSSVGPLSSEHRAAGRIRVSDLRRPSISPRSHSNFGPPSSEHRAAGRIRASGPPRPTHLVRPGGTRARAHVVRASRSRRSRIRVAWPWLDAIWVTAPSRWP